MKKLTIFLLIVCALCASAVNLALASQNSLVVPDGTGAQVRAGFNNALDTLNTIESGPSAPTTTEAYMLWCDTTNGLLKQRDPTNSVWIVLGTLGVAQMGHEPAITPGATSQYWRGDKTWQTLPSITYPGAGVPLSTGSAWGASYAVGTAANDLVQLDSSGQLPAVSGANLTNLPSSGVLTKVGTTTISSAASTTIAGLSAGVQYKIFLNLVQNTSAGNISLQFNSDTSNNYKYSIVIGGSSGFGGVGSSSAGLIYLAYGAGDAVGTSQYYTGEISLNTVTGNNDAVAVNSIGNFMGTSGAYRNVTAGGLYTGSAALSSITIFTSSGTLSGTVTIYQLN